MFISNCCMTLRMQSQNQIRLTEAGLQAALDADRMRSDRLRWGQAKEKKEKALAEQWLAHPEDVSRTVEDFNLILRVIVRPAA